MDPVHHPHQNGVPEVPASVSLTHHSLNLNQQNTVMCLPPALRETGRALIWHFYAHSGTHSLFPTKIHKVGNSSHRKGACSLRSLKRIINGLYISLLPELSKSIGNVFVCILVLCLQSAISEARLNFKFPSSFLCVLGSSTLQNTNILLSTNVMLLSSCLEY